jgi:hypothetical protein
MTAGLIAIRPPFRRHSPLGELIHDARKALFSLCPQASGSGSTGTVWQVKGAELTLSAAQGYGAAVYSLIRNGIEFINSVDLGRCLSTRRSRRGI